MRNNSYAPHNAISRYSIREFKTGAEPFMVAMIIIIIRKIGRKKWYLDVMCRTIWSCGCTLIHLIVTHIVLVIFSMLLLNHYIGISNIPQTFYAVNFFPMFITSSEVDIYHWQGVLIPTS